MILKNSGRYAAFGFDKAAASTYQSTSLNNFPNSGSINGAEIPRISHRISTLPESIWELKSLEYLNLCRNNLTSIPEKIGGLTSLQLLFIMDNQLRSVPDCFADLPNLKFMRIEHNKFRCFPPNLEEMRKRGVSILSDFDMFKRSKDEIRREARRYLDE